MSGGLDEITQPLERAAGTLISGTNFEAVSGGGYSRCSGYERFDGRARPSDAAYKILLLDRFLLPISVGDTVTGITSGATGSVIASVSTSGEKYVAVTKITGTFVIGESLKVVTVDPRGEITDISEGVSSALTHAQYLYLAGEVYRALIAAVPGTGSVLGVVEYNDVTYAFRETAGAALLYKSTAGGWSLVPMLKELSFTSGGGAYEVVVGNTITGATSGATGIVRKVVLKSGTWGAGTAAGKFMIDTQVGVFVAENLNVGANLNVATIAGNSATVSMLSGGKFAFIIENFGGLASTRYVYGCDGVNRGFEFDGTILTPIDTGMVLDKPLHLTEHKKHLCFAFAASFQHSAPGTPHVWSAIVGAGEIALGDNITGFYSQPGSAASAALSIFTRNRTQMLYGSGVGDWNLVPYRKELGAYAYTIQDVGYTMFLDDLGITEFKTAQEFGNFNHATVSDRIRNSINDLKSLAISSCVCRKKNEYRLFFSDGSAYYVTMHFGKVYGIMLQSHPMVANVLWSGEAVNGDERIYAGGEDGFVYQMEKGTSFDGTDISYDLALSYNFHKSPRIEKEYHNSTVEISSDSYVEFSLGYSLGYGSSENPQPDTQPVIRDFRAAQWDSGYFWDAFSWDGQFLSPSVLDTRGRGENISIAVSGISAIVKSFDLTMVIVQYTKLRRMRA